MLHARTDMPGNRRHFHVLLLAIAAIACAAERSREATVEVMRVAPPQLIRDSLEVTPRLSTTHDAPERGRVALNIEIGVRNAGGATKPVPRITFRAIRESARDTTPWTYEIQRRAVDSLRAGESADFGVTTSPGTLAAAPAADAVYRLEAMLGDAVTSRLPVPLGRVRVRAPADST